MHYYTSTSVYVNPTALTDIGPASLEAAGFSPRQREALAHYCAVFTASDAVDVPDDSLLAIPGFGRRMLARLRACVWAQ